MAKFRPAGSRKSKAKSNLAIIPCAFLILLGMALLFLLFYALLKSGT